MILKKSLVEVFTHPVSLLVMVVLDALFFFMWGFALTPISNSLSAHAVLFAGRNASSGSLILLMMIFFVCAFLLYLCFHGPAWWLARRIAGRKGSLRRYFLAFVKVNLLWFVFMVVLKIAGLFSDLHELATTGEFGTGFLGTVFFWLVVMLAFLSYPKPSLRSIFIPLRRSVPLLLISLVLLEIARLLPSPLYFNPMLGNIVSFLLVFPTLALIRVYAIHVVDDT
jgi:hypothetical protein